MVDDEQVYELKNVNMPIDVKIGVPNKLLDDEIKSFYLVGGINGEYQKIDFESNEDSIAFSGYIGNQYTFIYEKKANEVEKPSEDDKEPSKPSEDQNKPNEDDKKPNNPSEDDKKPDETIKDNDSNSIDSDVLGSKIDNVETNKKVDADNQNNKTLNGDKQNNKTLNKVQTGDGYQPLLFIFMFATSLAIPFVLKKKKRG